VQGLENPLLPHAGLLHQDVGNQCHAFVALAKLRQVRRIAQGDRAMRKLKNEIAKILS